jgi:hypothetical protein
MKYDDDDEKIIYYERWSQSESKVDSTLEAENDSCNNSRRQGSG